MLCIPILKMVEDFDLDMSESHNSVSGLKNFYEGFAKEIAARQNKQVTLDIEGISDTNEDAIPTSLAAAVKEITIQLLRNAIVHGIELPSQRQDNGKSPTGLIKLQFQNTDDKLNITLQDDGQGINYDNIRQRLVSLGRNTEKEASALTQNQLLSALFSSGFTTREQADEDGGRGVGLDIIKERVKELNGRLKVNTEKGKMTRFIISLPVE